MLSQNSSWGVFFHKQFVTEGTVCSICKTSSTIFDQGYFVCPLSRFLCATVVNKVTLVLFKRCCSPVVVVVVFSVR